jgi:hypothetical protein
VRDDRSRQDEALADLDRLPQNQLDGASGWLLQTTACDSYPTSAGVVYCCHPVLVDADDTEGATPSFAADADVTIYALNLGTQAPPSGTYLIGTGTGGRICFRFDG